MGKNILNKNKEGYSYQYTDLAEIHRYLEENNLRYYQYIERIDGDDYIMTVPQTIQDDGEIIDFTLEQFGAIEGNIEHSIYERSSREYLLSNENTTNRYTKFRSLVQCH